MFYVLETQTTTKGQTNHLCAQSRKPYIRKAILFDVRLCMDFKKSSLWFMCFISQRPVGYEMFGDIQMMILPIMILTPWLTPTYIISARCQHISRCLSEVNLGIFLFAVKRKLRGGLALFLSRLLVTRTYSLRPKNVILDLNQVKLNVIYIKFAKVYRKYHYHVSK